MKTRILSLIFFSLLFFTAHAEVFVVTSTADAGTGTLREALTLAAGNGVVTTDYINFNVPGNGEANRTITLQSELPMLSSNLILDASSQLGPSLGISPAKIKITVNPANYIVSSPDWGCFNIFNLNHVEIYGFAIDGFYNLRVLRSSNTGGSAINLYGSTDIAIGAPGKGNVFSKNETGFSVSSETILFRSSTRVKIQSNWIGLYTDGSELADLSSAHAYVLADNVEFGGSDPSFGNIVGGSSVFGFIFYGTDYKINFNRIGYLGNGTPGNKLAIISMYMTGAEFLDNQANRFRLYLAGKNIKILRNKESLLFPTVGTANIELYYATDIQIGSDDIADLNEFSSSPYTIGNSGSERVAVRKNIIHCTPYAYFNRNTTGVTIQVLVNNDNEYSGTAVANSEIYIYNDNSDCPSCSPLQFYTKVIADPSGKWRITGDFRANKFVANATLVHTSSEFTQPHILTERSGYWYRKTEPSCGQSNGTVEIANPVNILRAEWYNAATDVKVGDGFKIENLPPGQYYALGYNGKCYTRSEYNVDLFDVTPVFNTANLQVTQPGCGQANGSIRNVSYSYNAGPSTFKWVDDSGRTVSATNLDLLNLRAGSYTLIVSSGTSCVRSYGPIVLADIGGQGPSLDETSVVVTKATCGNPNASIKGINVFNASAIQWLNSSNVVVGRNADLVNVPAGKYRLTVSNASCAATSAEYTVEATISNQNYFPAKQFKDATCNQNNGTITITFSQVVPKSMRWVNASTNADIGTTATVSNLAAGFYKLYLTDENSCESLYETYQIKTIIPPLLTESAVHVVNDQCGMNSGGVTGITISGGVVPYRYEWRNQANQLMATTIDLHKVPAGKYTFAVIDNVGCSVRSSTFTVGTDEVSLPDPVVPAVQICAAGLATIVPPAVQEGRFLLYASTTAPLPLATTNGVFQVNVTNTSTYYLSYATGTCESRRVPVTVLVAQNALNMVNTFSPNNDGVNDTWKIKDLEKYPEFTLHIFNRNGQEVFSTRDPHFAFDGMNNGTALPVGVYYYMLSLRVGCATITGSLTLLR